jgi:branched-chain amino acid transport system permease protein
VDKFLAFTIVGIVTGSLYAVSASGLVVTYATSGIFNIAHGAIGMLMAFTFWQIAVGWGLPLPIAFALTVLVIAPLFGALIERVLIRALRGASVGVSLVVTVGLMVTLIGLAQSVWNPQEARIAPRFFGQEGFEVAGNFLFWHDAITLVLALGVALFLWQFLTRTRLGVAMRAVVDDRNLMALNGARPDRLSMVSWAMGASLAAAAGIMLAPTINLSVIPLTLLVVNAYAAAVVGKLKSLPLTFLGALALGLTENYVVGYVSLQGALQGLRLSIPTLFLFAFLLLVPEARLRAGRIGGAVTPRLPSRRRAAFGAVAFVGVALLLSGFLDPVNLGRAAQGLALGIIMLSLVPLTGFGGQVSLCQMTFAGLGAFAMARLAENGSILGLVAALVLAAVVGALVALPALRLQGLYLALATMAFAVLMDNMFFPNQQVFGNLGSLEVTRLRLFGLSFDSDRSFFVLLAVAFSLFALLVMALRRGQFGRALSAMRDSPVASAMVGLDLTKVKLAVFMISAAMAGVGGAFFGMAQGAAGPLDFLMIRSLPLLLLAVVGGITTATGALIGGMSLAILPVIQSRVPAIGGLVLLTAGMAGILLGRNPNGIAQFVAEGLRRVLPGRTRAEEETAAVPAPEEVRVAAAAG